MSGANLAVIEHHQPPAVSMRDMIRLADAFANSGFFGVKTTDQALALMAIAQAEGLHPAIAARDYHVIQGRPTLKADAMLARFQSAGGKVQWLCMSDERVAAKFSHPVGGTIEIDWDMERAKKAGLSGKAGGNWQKFPRQMLRARVVSEGVRTVYPGVVVGTYTPEEVADFDTDDRASRHTQANAKQQPPQTQTSEAVHEAEFVELPPWPSEKFDAQRELWEPLLRRHKRTADDVIGKIESSIEGKYALTPEQVATIRNVEKESN